MEHFDTIVIGAGLSGIAAAYHVKKMGKSFCILEGRQSVGGTWDLFRYPGIRSDSDMYTLGYSFSPWMGKKAIADGGDILEYINHTADKYDFREKIKIGHQVVCVEWSSKTNTWTVAANHIKGDAVTTVQMTCNFVFSCTGYYDYKEGYTPDFVDANKFRGKVIHPQFWPENYDFSDKKIVVIGSGATAVTLLPQLAQKAEHVTMLQRSPTYIAPVPAEVAFCNLLLKWLPPTIAHFLNRWYFILYALYFYYMCKLFPKYVRDLIFKGTKKSLGKLMDVDKHFTPKYDPWDQRFCVCPNADFFKALKKGSASIVTAHIDRFTEKGVLLKDEEGELEADVIVTATGLKLIVGGGMNIVVDGKKIAKLSDHVMYKSAMLNNIPNLVVANGYVNLTYTLRVDLLGSWLCRIRAYMDSHDYTKCVPKYTPGGALFPYLELQSGYIQRGMELYPSQGEKSPWRNQQNYFTDMYEYWFASVQDKDLHFT